MSDAGVCSRVVVCDAADQKVAAAQERVLLRSDGESDTDTPSDSTDAREKRVAALI